MPKQAVPTKPSTPRHEHDCDSCLFLGRQGGEQGERDLYAHEREHGTELIARYGVDGNYSCATVFHLDEALPAWLTHQPYLREAYLRFAHQPYLRG